MLETLNKKISVKYLKLSEVIRDSELLKKYHIQEVVIKTCTNSLPYKNASLPVSAD